MRLGIDCDGVCANWYKGAIQALNQRFELDLDECGEPDHWDWIEENITKKQWNWLWSGGVDEGLFGDLDLIEGTYGALGRLTQNHRVYLITKRPQKARADTISWVARNLPFNFQGIMVEKDKWKVECEIYIDDKPENVEDLKRGRPASYVVLQNRRYNKDFSWPDRVDDWAGFERFVKIVERRLV